MSKTLLQRFSELASNKEIAMVQYQKSSEVPYDMPLTVQRKYSWKEYVNYAQNFSKFLKDNNTQNVAIHAFNCPEWFISAMGSLGAKKYFCGIYNTNRDSQCLHVMNKGECDVLVIDNQNNLLEYYKNVLDDMKKYHIILINKPQELSNQLLNHKIYFWNDLNLQKASDSFAVSLDDVKMDDICTLIFTSGTTGNPKAVEMTNENINAAVEAVLDRFHLNRFEERIVTYLPLSHIAGQALDIYCPLFCAGTVHFADNMALKGTLKRTLLVAKPTLFLGVPRVWEKFREALLKVAAQKYNESYGSQLLGGFMNVIKKIEHDYNTTDSKCYSRTLYPLSFISNFVVSKIKEKIGLDQCRYFLTGAAPISHEVLDYFSSIGINISEIYGMSESAGVITVSNPLTSFKGSCGSPPKGITVKIDSETQEILVKGKNVFKKYHNHEGSNDIDEDGYLHTGDCGKLVDGNLYITGRIKELVITAGGENIPPVLIENRIMKSIRDNNSLTKNEYPESHCVLVGDKRKFLSILVFNPSGDKQLSNEEIDKARLDYNNNHAISNSQKVQKFTVINDKLSVENGLITPTLKLKRKKILDKYSKNIDSLYLVRK